MNQPLTIGQIFDRTFRAYRANFRTYFTLTLVLQGILTVLSVVQLLMYVPSVAPNVAEIMGGAEDDMTAAASMLVSALTSSINTTGVVALIASVLIGPVFTGSVTRVALRQALSQEVPEAPSLLAASPRLLGKFFPVSLCSGLVGAAIIVGGLVLISLLSAMFAQVPLLLLLFVFAAMFVMLVLVMWIWLVFPVAEAEGLKNFKAVSRAFRLAKPQLVRVAWIILLFSLLMILLSSACEIVASTVVGIFGVTGMTGAIITLLINRIIAFFWAPLSAIMCVHLYLDASARADGGDILARLSAITGEEYRD